MAPAGRKRFGLSIAPDRLAVTLQVFPPRTDVEDEAPPTAVEVLEALHALGVREGIDERAIVEALEAPEGGTAVVARGVAPVPGEHGRVELLFPTEVLIDNPGDEDARVDWRSRMVFPEARPGQELALLHPPVPGQPGRAVDGEEIPPPRVLAATLLAGPGVEVVPNRVRGGAVAVATQPGMPTALRRERAVLVKVAPLVTVPGDVDLGTGNVRVQGSISVRGSVREGCAVVASESVLVKGDVDAAEVAAGRDVTVAGRVVGGRVQAGGERRLRLLAVDFDRLVLACRQLERTGLSCAEAVRLLLSTKFAHIRQALGEEGERPDERDWIEEARNLLFAPVPTLTLDQVDDLGRKLHLIHESDQTGNIKASYVQNATLQAAGSVTVGKGCFFASILAGGDVVVEGTFRAGRIVAGGNVRIGEAGSAAESRCEIEVPKEGRVSFKRVHPGVVVRFGPLTYRFEKACRGVTLRATPEGVEFVPM